MTTAFFTLVPALLAHLAGCFDVNYSYFEAETRPPQALAQKEWVTADDSLSGAVTIQHYRYQNGAPVPHFLEEWRPLAAGAWEQSIVGADGTVRYACAGRFTQNQWRCWAPSAPMPRRDEGRTDYAVLDREVTVQITATGWVQSERNDKRDEGGALVANELGWNSYARAPDGQCPR